MVDTIRQVLSKMKDDIDELVTEVISHTSKDEYGSSYHDHLLEQYKIYVEMADKISERRASANSFFLTVITVLISIMGIVSGFGIQTVNVLRFWITIVSIVGLILCYSWYRILESYRQLNSGKFKVIQMIERKLPLALYYGEWMMLGKGQDTHIYRPLTHVEKWIPMLFTLLFATILVVGLIYLTTLSMK